MSWAMVGAAAVSVVGGMMARDSAGDAAGAQGESVAAATGEQRRQFNLNRSDLAPWRETGTAAQRRLGVLLGLQTNASTSPSAQRNWQSFYDDALTRAPMVTDESLGQWVTAGADPVTGGGSGGQQIWTPGPGSVRNTAWARTEADRLFRSQTPATTTPDAGFGDLNRRFTTADRDADPVYQSGLEFGRREGTDAINSRAIRAGGYDSGATLRALTRFGTDYGNTRANESRNRFVADQDTTFNRLSGVSGSGQTSTAQTVAAGTNSANSISDLITQGGNARAAGIVGGNNAWAGGLNNAASGYQRGRIFDRLFPSTSTGNIYGTGGGPTPYYGSSASWAGDD